MKKILFFILISIMVLIFCSCSINENRFPQLKICRSNLRSDNIYVALRDGHNFNIQHLYEEVDTEDGYDIVVHIVKENL